MSKRQIFKMFNATKTRFYANKIKKDAHKYIFVAKPDPLNFMIQIKNQKLGKSKFIYNITKN